MGILLKVDERPQRTFLQKFFEGAFLGTDVLGGWDADGLLTGRDEDAVRPAASGVV